MTKAYIWYLNGVQITTRLVKNEIWRWYSTADKIEHSPITGFGHGSNALTHWGAIKQVRKEYAKLIRRP